MKLTIRIKFMRLLLGGNISRKDGNIIYRIMKLIR